jgi:hypothetical protein
MVLQSRSRVLWVNLVDLGFFCYFLIKHFLKKFHHLTLIWLIIEIYNFFICYLWSCPAFLLEFDRLTRVDLIIFFVIFFQCKPLILDWFGIEFHFFFSDFLSISLSWSYDLGQGLSQLTWGFFFLYFFLISSFNIGFIEN